MNAARNSQQVAYQPMTLVDLARHLASAVDDQHRWRLIAEMLEEYRQEPEVDRGALLTDEPPTTGSGHGDVFLAASAYIAPGGDPEAPRSFDHPNLRVMTASPEHLLAMKAIAARRRDLDDLRLLVDQLGLTSSAQVVGVCRRVFPDEALPDRALLVLEDLFEEKA